jgi:small conductance mechanosensitive channel
MRQLHLSVTVPLVADVGATLAVATEVVTRNPRVLKDPPPLVGITAIGDGSIRIGIDPWVKVTDVGPAEAELYRALTEHFHGRGIWLGPAPSDVRLVDGAALTAAR